MKPLHRLPIRVAAIGLALCAAPLAAQDGVSANRAPIDSPRQSTLLTGSDPLRGSDPATSPWRSEGRVSEGKSSQKPALPRRPLRQDAQREKAEGKNREHPSANLSPWTAGGALSVVILLILVLARVFRKHAPLFHQTLPSEALEVLGRRFVDQRNSILLVRIATRIVVIGSGPNGLQPLGEVADPVEVDLVAGLCRRDPDQRGIGGSFFRLLKRQAVAPPTSPRPGARTTPRQPTNASVRVEPSDTSPPSLVNSVALHSPSSIVPPSSMVPEETEPAQSEQELRRRLRGSGAVHREAFSEGMR